MFVDLQAAFNSVDRRTLGKIMRERGIREGLTKRVEELVRETKSRAGARGCPLSPQKFNVLIADLEEVMEEKSS